MQMTNNLKLPAGPLAYLRLVLGKLLIGLNLDVFESPSAEEGFECRSPNAFLSTFHRSRKAEKYHWGNNHHSSPSAVF